MLPTGVTVTKVTYYWWDADATDTTATLTRTNLPATGSTIPMATVSSSGTPGHSSSLTTTISNAVIDNNAAMYYVKTVLPGGAAMCTDAVQIAYTG